MYPSANGAARRILEALACGRTSCPCVASARHGSGNTHCPGHDDHRPSLSVSAQGDKLLVRCQASCAQDAVVAALKERGLWLAPASSADRVDTRRHRAGDLTRYEIRDATGRLVAVHERRDRPDGSKSFIWQRPDGFLGLNGRSTSALPLFGTERLRDLPPGAQVIVGEGEKAAASLQGRGIAALGTVTGAAGKPGSEALAPLLPLRVILWPDNDPPGRSHMEAIAAALNTLGHGDIRILEWLDAPPGGDAADFQGDAAALAALVEAAKPWTAPPPVDLAALLDKVRAFIRLFMVMGDNELDAVALWIAHTHALAAAEATPYLSVSSAQKRSGKSRFLEVLALLVARPWFTSRVSPAVLIRKLAQEPPPTLLLDESDAAFKGAEEYAEVLRTVLNAGHRRSGVASLCVKAGRDFELSDFSVFGAKAIAGIGKLPDTVADRAIPIILKRRRPSEEVERFRRRDAERDAQPLQERLAAWAASSIPALQEARPALPPELDDRAADGWEPLLAIADMAGGDWPSRTRSSAVILSGDGREDESLGVRLLADIRDAFAGAARLSSAALVKYLVGIEEAPWGDLRGRPLDARGLARTLKPFGIRPSQMRFAGESAGKGYARDAFADAWCRYLPASETRETSETEPVGDVSDEGDVSDVERNTHGIRNAPPSGVSAVSVVSPPRSMKAREGGPEAWQADL